MAMEPVSGTVVHARTDLSLGGCYVGTMSPFPRGTNLHLRLTNEERLFNRKRSWWSRMRIWAGSRFAATEPDPASRTG